MPDTRSIHGVFERMAADSPDSVAVEHVSGRLTYAELDARANYLAKYFQDQGLRQGAVIAVALPHSEQLVVTLLAVLKCGAIYLPIDEAYPKQRVQLYFEEASVKAVVGNASRIGAFADDLVCVDVKDAALFSTSLPEFKSHSSNPEDGAYIVFTSGSTGKPKGVLVPHRAVIRLVISTNYIQFLPSDKILQFAPPAFDASTFEFWGALLNGATLVPYSGTGLDPNTLKADIERHQISILWLTAALFHVVADKFIQVLKPLRVLLAGGDVLNPNYVNRVLDHFPGITVVNGYGPTENTTFTCCHVMTAENRPSGIVPIGKAITGTTIFVLDESLNPVEAGQVGELYASGEGVALGYLNEEGKQGAFFRDERLSAGMIYRTGDLVRVNSTGDLEFLGRKDGQVKIRGYRVSLEEIRTCIVDLSGISDAAVVARKFDTGDQLLVAYVQPKDGVELRSREIKTALSQTLPLYMIPDQFLFSSALPINVNGKIDRRKIQLIADAQCMEAQV